VFDDIKSSAIEIPMLQLHLLSILKVLRGKQQDMIVKGIVGLEHHDLNHLFPSIPSDNTLRRHLEES
jgi:hypothetical protein